MISLTRHIEIILLEHDCVIVPGFGGFIANHQEARYNDEQDGLFLPPTRSIAFNQELKINDGLLVQSYMQAYDAAYPEAYLQMEKDIDRMNAALDIEGRYVMNGIGVLVKDIDGQLHFTPEEAGLLTPGLYGLYSFGQLTLAEALKRRDLENAMLDKSMLNIQTETDNDTSEAQTTDENYESAAEHDSERKQVVIKMSRRWIDAGIAAAVAVVFFLAMSIPSLNINDDVEETCIAGSLYVAPAAETHNNISKPKVAEQTADTPNNVAETKAQEQSAVAKKAEQSAEAKTAEQSKEEGKTSTEVKKSEEVKAPETPKPYVIVLASCVTRPNADAFISSIDKMGYHEARFVTYGSVNRVVYSAFETEAKAREVLQVLKKEKCFKDAWILQTK